MNDSAEAEAAPGTENGFCAAVPEKSRISAVGRVQEADFALLYPRKAGFELSAGYRRRILYCCTRKKQDLTWKKGTGSGFYAPVPLINKIHFKDNTAGFDDPKYG